MDARTDRRKVTVIHETSRRTDTGRATATARRGTAKHRTAQENKVDRETQKPLWHWELATIRNFGCVANNTGFSPTWHEQQQWDRHLHGQNRWASNNKMITVCTWKTINIWSRRGDCWPIPHSHIQSAARKPPCINTLWGHRKKNTETRKASRPHAFSNLS